MITAAQLRTSRALLGINQETLADMVGVPLPSMRRMEATSQNVRGGGRGVRCKSPSA
jgi:predicted transcriptional regulator